MNFIKLEIHNLASLDRVGGETIEFQEGALRESTIFSIVGPTGSGKSTLLDAICLALYNMAPRYPRKKGDRNQNIEIYGELEEGEKNRLAPTDARNILTRGKKDGYSKLTFLANNGNVYRAEWHVHMKTKNYEDAKTSLYLLSMKDGVQTEEIAEWDKLPQIIGLDYGQFLRTVLIAQGSFANFLTAKENERYELLEKLIGCEEQYSIIATNIKAQKDAAVQAYNQIVAAFSAQEKDIIPEEELDALKLRVAELERLDKEAKEELKKLSEALGWYEADEKHIENIGNYQQAFDNAKVALEAVREQAERLALHDVTVPAVSLYKEIKSAEAKIAGCDTRLTQLSGSIKDQEEAIKTEVEVNLEQLKQVAQKASSELEQQKPHINKAREIKAELEGLKQALTEKDNAQKDAGNAKTRASEELASNKKNIESSEGILQSSKDALESLQKQIEESQEKLRQKTADAISDLTAESKKLEGLDAETLQNAKTAAERTQNELNAAIRIQTDLQTKTTLRTQNLDNQKRLTERNANIAEALKAFKIEALTEECDTLVKSYTLMTSEKWELHRSALKDGEACPLCGAVHHPYQDNAAFAPVVDDMKKLIDAKRQELKKLTDEKQSLQQEQSQNNGLLDGIKQALESLDNEISALGNEWKAISAAHSDWPEDAVALNGMMPLVDKNVDDASDRLSAYNAIVTKLDELRSAKETAEKAQQDFDKRAQEKRQEAEGKVNEANTLLATEKGKTENLAKQLDEKTKALEAADKALADAKRVVEEKTAALKQEIGDKDPDAYEKTLTDAKTNADNAVTSKNEAISEMREALKGLVGQESETKSQRDEEKTILGKKQNELTAWIADYNKNAQEKPLSEEVIALLYSATDNWEAIRAKNAELSIAFTEANTTLVNEKKAYDEHQEKKPEQSKEDLAARKTELEGISNDELIDSKARMQRHDDAKKTMGEMFETKQKAELLMKEWEEITDAIGTDGKTLRKIAQCYTLRFLIEHANVEIRKFNTRYELQQVKNSLGIRVIDHDRADDVRDTTSLSGGETFIVSLGLALGLSALSSRNISFENLFIDEGFGTLDPDTLATVIDSLAMLQSSQGKKVGVISHTDTMSERITTQIRIIKNGNSGSSHIEIYP